MYRTLHLSSITIAFVVRWFLISLVAAWADLPVLYSTLTNYFLNESMMTAGVQTRAFEDDNNSESSEDFKVI